MNPASRNTINLFNDAYNWLKEIQKVLDLPEPKIVKLSDTRWLAHERCVNAVKASYSSIILALENIYETSHVPEAHGLSKALSGHFTIAAMYLALLNICISYPFYICQLRSQSSSCCPRERVRVAVHMQGTVLTITRLKIVPTPSITYLLDYIFLKWQRLAMPY